MNHSIVLSSSPATGVEKSLCNYNQYGGDHFRPNYASTPCLQTAGHSRLPGTLPTPSSAMVNGSLNVPFENCPSM